ncbi:iron-containing alcohol dehydrogenase [Hyphobacterium sp. CCMP332]|nr:iron-containing alcohol dehydrogenase [Hyphobacterium sp. CCMP332]
MENFTSYNPTKIEFGKGCVSKLGDDASSYGNKALILIGKGSVKKNGVLDQVVGALKNAGISYEIFEGVKSNPEFETADKATTVAKEAGCQMIIPVGGGSVIDTAKAVAMGFYRDHSIWDFYVKKAEVPTKALPIISVLTLAATGTEMNQFTVIQNTREGRKYGFGSPLLYPKTSYLDPEFTKSVPTDYTAFGISDLIAHTLEQYFDPSDAPLSDAIASDIISQAIRYGLELKDNPHDYDARANIMWLATMALNGTLRQGKKGGDWGVHGFEHSLSVLYDIAHGAGLSIVYPAWMKVFFDDNSKKLQYLSERVFGSADPKVFIDGLEDFFKTIGTPVRLKEAGIQENARQKIVENLKKNKVNGAFFKMNDDIYNSLLDKMWEN